MHSWGCDSSEGWWTLQRWIQLENLQLQSVYMNWSEWTPVLQSFALTFLNHLKLTKSYLTFQWSGVMLAKYYTQNASGDTLKHTHRETNRTLKQNSREASRTCSLLSSFKKMWQFAAETRGEREEVGKKMVKETESVLQAVGRRAEVTERTHIIHPKQFMC